MVHQNDMDTMTLRAIWTDTMHLVRSCTNYPFSDFHHVLGGITEVGPQGLLNVIVFGQAVNGPINDH